MTVDCEDGTEERVQPDLPGGPDVQVADPADGVLVTRASARSPLTAREELDVHSAITAGLAGYLISLRGEVSGRDCSLAWVAADWADYDDGTHPLPSAGVHSEEESAYMVDSGLAPGTPHKLGKPDDAGNIDTLTCSANYQIERLWVDVWCADKVQRQGVRRMLEAAFWPVEWMSGFRLVLPRYHGAVAEYLLASTQMTDSPEMVGRGLRTMRLTLRARCPVYRLHELRLARVGATQVPYVAPVNRDRDHR